MGIISAQQPVTPFIIVLEHQDASLVSAPNNRLMIFLNIRVGAFSKTQREVHMTVQLSLSDLITIQNKFSWVRGKDLQRIRVLWSGFKS